MASSSPPPPSPTPASCWGSSIRVSLRNTTALSPLPAPWPESVPSPVSFPPAFSGIPSAGLASVILPGPRLCPPYTLSSVPPPAPLSRSLSLLSPLSSSPLSRRTLSPCLPPLPLPAPLPVPPAVPSPVPIPSPLPSVVLPTPLPVPPAAPSPHPSPRTSPHPSPRATHRTFSCAHPVLASPQSSFPPISPCLPPLPLTSTI